MKKQKYDKAVFKRHHAHSAIKLASFNSIYEIFKGVDPDLAIEKSAHQYGVKPDDIYQQIFTDMFKVFSPMDKLYKNE